MLDTIALTSAVRRVTAHSILLDNPLANMVTVSMTCIITSEAFKGNCTEIHGPASFKLPAKSVASEFTFEFLPLRVREFTARLSLVSSELGAFHYDLVLAATAASPMPTQAYVAAIGEAVVKRYRFVNYCTTRSELSVSVDSDDYTIPATINAAPALKSGSEMYFDVMFEPSKLGNHRATMTINSAIGGEYVCPLMGQCLPSNPAGPYAMKPNPSKNTIAFKNIFATQETFEYKVDNDSFSVKERDVIKSKDTKEIIIKFDCNRADDGPATRQGKLVITCVTGLGSGTSWTYYLQGIVTT